MILPDITQYVQLGGQVVVVVLFLRYLSKRDTEWISSHKANADSSVVLARALQKLTDTIEINIPAVSKNTGAVEDNTDTIKKANGNGKRG